jgi:hypothetical protein
MIKLHSFSLHTAKLDNFQELNTQLLQGLEQHINDDATRRTHEFFGRFENIYIDTQQIPQLGEVLHSAIEIASEILKRPAEGLKAGLWFNVMNPGDKTTLHRHDDDDELLSAVYYIKVAENSGTLILGKDAVQTNITPQEGMFVLFPPDMPHQVTENLSQQSRVSLGINIGPVHPEE